MSSFNAITILQLSRLIGLPHSPIIIDVRIDADVNDDPYLIPTSFRCTHTEIETLLPELIDKSVVLVCQKGLKLSQGAAALLRTQGIKAEYLEGGTLAWQAAQQPVLAIERLSAFNLERLNRRQSTLWVTKQRPKVDRVACAWLIRRFIDPQAKFLFVARSEVLSVAEKFSATPFDVDGGHWSHRNELCTFDVILDDLHLNSIELKQLAAIVRSADTGQLNLSAESSGLLAMSLGLSRLFRDDLMQIEAGLLFYDALYCWLRDAQDESHEH